VVRRSYKVYRSTSSKKGFKLVKTTKSLSYTNTKLKTGTRYYYKVVPHRGKVKAAASATVSVKPVLKKTKFKTAGTSLGKVKVTWSKVSGATGYKVYRSTSATKGFKVVKTVKGTSFTDTKLANNKTYYYKVAAYRKVSSKTVSSGATSVFKITTPRKAGHYYFSKGGFFVLQTSGSGYYEVCKKTKCNWSTADTNHIFQNKTYVDVPAGYYLRFTAYGSKDARITRADSHYATTKSTITAPGHYLVGFDLKPGEYRIYSSKDWSYTICAWTSCDWTNGYDDIELVSKGEYIIITLSSGDFLEISTFGGSIKGTRR